MNEVKPFVHLKNIWIFVCAWRTFKLFSIVILQFHIRLLHFNNAINFPSTSTWGDQKSAQIISMYLNDIFYIVATLM